MSAQRFPALARIDVPLAIFIAAVITLQLTLYCVYPLTPFHHPTRGWEGWWDQRQYLKSARAFAMFDLSESQHWYPIGYALLVAPFVRVIGDAFFVPNFIGVIVFAWMFQRYFRPMIGMAGVAAALFGALALPYVTQFPLDTRCLLWLQFVVPWNTAPIAALFMSLLCLMRDIRADDSLRKDFLIGALVGAVAAIKPVELLPLSVLGLAYLAITVRSRAMPWQRIGMAVVGAVIVAGPVVGLDAYIHHGLLSPYVVSTHGIGMSISNLPRRAIDLFIDAGPSFGEPHAALMGLLIWFPILAPLALVGAFRRPREIGVPTAFVAASLLTYLAYNDFSPANLLHFALIHYVMWTFPVIAAAGLATATIAIREPRWRMPCAVTVFVFCVIGALRIELKAAPYSHIESRMDAHGRLIDIRFAEATPLNALDLPPLAALAKWQYWPGNPLTVTVDGEELKTFSGYQLDRLADRWRLIFKRPVVARNVSFTLPDIEPGQPVDVRPIRFSLRFAASPWAAHSSAPNPQ